MAKALDEVQGDSDALGPAFRRLRDAPHEVVLLPADANGNLISSDQIKPGEEDQEIALHYVIETRPRAAGEESMVSSTRNIL